MAREPINYGSIANDPTADTLREAFEKADDNFIELYDFGIGDLSDVVIGTPSFSQTLVYDDSVSPPIWTPGNPDLAAALGDLADVDIADSPGPNDGDVLTYDTSVSPPVWRAEAPTGGGGEAMVLLATSSPSGTGTVSFTGISGSYTDLRVVVRGRSSLAATNEVVIARFNNDSGANYDTQYVRGNNATASAAGAAGQTSFAAGNIAAASSTAGVQDMVDFTIYGYAQTTFHKAIMGSYSIKQSSAATGFFTNLVAGWYRSTSAITRVDVILGSGNFVAGSKVSLYGIVG